MIYLNKQSGYAVFIANRYTKEFYLLDFNDRHIEYIMNFQGDDIWFVNTLNPKQKTATSLSQNVTSQTISTQEFFNSIEAITLGHL